jgi:16S rRNA (cytidine1402-2'-O)-methyltransferase
VGTLYLVSTPIGNLEDMTARAVRVLGEVQLIAAEDTRVTRKLLSHFDIHTKLISYFEHNKLTKLDSILAALGSGDVALVSDAGTPGLNDPGYELVRAATETGHRVSPVPGPSSPIAALIASGLPTDSFLYLGYLPRTSSERKSALEKVAGLPYTLIFLETPHRLLGSLRDLEMTLGNRRIAVARELTKLHEELWRGAIHDAIGYFKEPRGEIVLVLEGNTKAEATKWTEGELLDAIQNELEHGETPSALAAKLANSSGWRRRDIYALTIRQDVKRMQ